MDEAAFHAAIGDASQPLPVARFGIYRNNVSAALRNALRVRYPLTARALGERVFQEAADRFAVQNKPQSAVLIGYGADFPAEVEPLHLADIARVESAWWQAYHAADAVPLTPAALSSLSPEVLLERPLRLHPSLQLLALQTAGASNWQALHDGKAADPSSAEQWVMIVRPEAGVEVRIIARDSHDFLSALTALGTIATATEAVSADHPNFVLQEQFAALLSGHIICGVDV